MASMTSNKGHTFGGHGNPADRVAWRFPTSDVYGSHSRSDLESYITLVRRKIQEKYFTVRDLIIGIR
jgi:hypothetical protein